VTLAQSDINANAIIANFINIHIISCYCTKL